VEYMVKQYPVSRGKEPEVPIDPRRECGRSIAGRRPSGGVWWRNNPFVAAFPIVTGTTDIWLDIRSSVKKPFPVPRRRKRKSRFLPRSPCTQG